MTDEDEFPSRNHWELFFAELAAADQSVVVEQPLCVSLC